MTESTQAPAPSNFTPKNPLNYAVSTGLQAGAVGAFVSAIQNALDKHSRGATGFLTRTGGTIGFFGASNSIHTGSIQRLIGRWLL